MAMRRLRTADFDSCRSEQCVNFPSQQPAKLTLTSEFGQKQPLAIGERIQPVILSAQHTVQPSILANYLKAWHGTTF
jgi:hypothetical protein